ncbi:molybdopterin oxidoreductase [Bordetella trematum]|nr:molybdopterin oxidoreductase [Bordetella trematum]
MGDLVIPPNNQRPIVMLAGGIGITPFYGMLRDLAHRHAQGETISDITLLYGNRTQASSAWSQQLTELTQRLPQLRVVHVFGEDNVLVPTTAERNAQHIGLIDASLIQREIPHPREPCISSSDPQPWWPRCKTAWMPVTFRQNRWSSNFFQAIKELASHAFPTNPC